MKYAIIFLILLLIPLASASETDLVMMIQDCKVVNSVTVTGDLPINVGDYTITQTCPRIVIDNKDGVENKYHITIDYNTSTYRDIRTIEKKTRAYRQYTELFINYPNQIQNIINTISLKNNVYAAMMLQQYQSYELLEQQILLES